MFRKPRTQTAIDTPLSPSTGRPPTPPSFTTIKAASKETHAVPFSTTKVPLPLLGRSQTVPRSTSRPGVSMGKAKGKPNGSILSFFKKKDYPNRPAEQSTTEEGDLFFQEDEWQNSQEPTQTPTPPRDDGAFLTPSSIDEDNSFLRYNEHTGSVKRQRMADQQGSLAEGGNVGGLSNSLGGREMETSSSTVAPGSNEVSMSHIVSAPAKSNTSPTTRRDKVKTASTGPFVEDSESEDDLTKELSKAVFGIAEPTVVPGPSDCMTETALKGEPIDENIEDLRIIPTLKREATSIVGDDGFDGIEDFIDDEFPEDGEEYMERQWMDEQRRIELGIEDEDDADEKVWGIKGKDDLDLQDRPYNEAEANSCPICNVDLGGITSEAASVHVNHCLDGNPIPLPQPVVFNKKNANKPANTSSPHKRFQRAAVAKPGQENPFNLGATKSNESSAFSKLMSSHAEDAAWATAAASELSSRGKAAYQRTCPFYKILPGFFICVDAFRYGAVEGCKAYFLSHFHSDHYIGLTSSWCHGPIYCSHVTANLVRRQLRVDPKWVFDLDFDRKVEVPGTQGVEVTMIPANHCPGSSLYLFEKVVGKGKTPKLQRVLHCGDFRACPAHVQHPLLRPDLIDSVTGKNTGQQKLDVCYLDTTYLTPKYAFPSQEEVIKACADMCVSLSKDKVDETDDWEKTKKDRAGSGMVKFVRQNSGAVKLDGDEDDIDAMKVNTKSGKKTRGRLLVIVGTYSIGKERICLGVARALNSKIYAPPNKQKICAALEDAELMARLTDDPLEAQVHMQMLMEIRAETLADYLTGFKPHFSRIVGFRPSGWNYRPPNGRFVESPAVQTVLHSDNWKSKYCMADLVPQRGSTRDASCFGVPYSEHSSFRELTMFCCALRIDKIIPTVNVGSAKSREKMKGWCEKWAMEKKKNGLFKVQDGQAAW